MKSSAGMNHDKLRWREITKRTIVSWRSMFDRRTLMADVAAGLTVAMVALPLNLALAVACGLPPHVGLLSGAIAGVVGSLLGGGRYQITGPEVALAPMTLAIVDAHGLEGLVVATVLAGLMQIVLGLLRVGGIVRAIPRPVVGGFMAAVGLLVFDSQIPRWLGLTSVHRLSAIRDPSVLLEASPTAIAIGALVVVTMLVLARAPKAVPGPLVALALAVGATALFGLDVARIEPIDGDARLLPTWPSLDGIDWWAILPSALSLTMLASVDSLLCAVSIDQRTRESHDSDQELVAQGIANVASGLFGGMPVAAAIVRSSVAVEARAATRMAGLVQSATLGLVLFAFGAHLDHVPLAALAGVLVVVGQRLIHVRELRAVARISRLEAGVFVATMVAILVLGFVPGVLLGIGLALAAFATNVRKQLYASPGASEPDVQVVTIGGALFFGSQSELPARVGDASLGERPLVLDVENVRIVDASGIAALRALVEDLATDTRPVRVAGVPSGLRDAMTRELGPACAGVHTSRAGAIDALRGLAAARASRRPREEAPSPRHSIGTAWLVSRE